MHTTPQLAVDCDCTWRTCRRNERELKADQAALRQRFDEVDRADARREAMQAAAEGDVSELPLAHNAMTSP